MKIRNLSIRFSLFFLSTFVIILIMNVFIKNTESINPHFLIDAILKSIYISIIYPSSYFLDEVRKRENNIEFKRKRNKFLVSIFLFLWIVITIPFIIEKQIMGKEVNWSRSFLSGLALALFAILFICLLDIVLNRNKDKK